MHFLMDLILITPPFISQKGRLYTKDGSISSHYSLIEASENPKYQPTVKRKMFWGSFHHIRMSSSAFSPGVKSYSSPQGNLCVSRLPPALLSCIPNPVTVSPLHLYPTHTHLSPGLLPQLSRSPVQHLVHNISILITATSPFLVHSPIILKDLNTRAMSFSCSEPMLPFWANSSITLTSQFLCCFHSRALQFCSAFSFFNTWILKCSSLTLTSYPLPILLSVTSTGLLTRSWLRLGFVLCSVVFF